MPHIIPPEREREPPSSSQWCIWTLGMNRLQVGVAGGQAALLHCQWITLPDGRLQPLMRLLQTVQTAASKVEGAQPGACLAPLCALTPDSSWSRCLTPQAWHHSTLVGLFVFILLHEV